MVSDIPAAWGREYRKAFFTVYSHMNIEMGFYLNIFLKGHDHEIVVFEKIHKGTF